MRIQLVMNRAAVAVLLGGALLSLPLPARGVGLDQSVPGILEAGFDSWAKGGGMEAILMGWQRGGLLEGSNKASAQARYLRSLTPVLGTYRSRELIQNKEISRSSRVVYLSINFDRGVIYGRFLIYRTERDWVVQNMDFSERPEAVMPWLAFEGQNYAP